METADSKITYKVMDFTEYPGPRYRTQGDDSGEEFYFKILKNLFEDALRRSKEERRNIFLEINLDDTAGYASSFLDEAFGNLSFDFTEGTVKKHLKIISEQEPDWIEIIMNKTIPEWHRKKLSGTPRKSETSIT